MKMIRLFAAVPFLLLFCSFSHADIEKTGPPYVEISTVADTSLLPKETAYVFRFITWRDTVRNDTIRFGYNGTEQKIVTDAKGIATVKIPSRNYKFRFYYNVNYLEVEEDSVKAKPGMCTTAEVRFGHALEGMEMKKPVIYVYPEKTIPVAIKLDVKGQLEFTYPGYNNGWNFTADPDGTIHMNGKQYDYLFWDAQTDFATKKMDLQSGFVVKKDSLLPFFENKLAAMGLSPREAEDFITFWCPLMATNELNFVHFEFNAGYDQFAEIEITPKPDNLFRVMMLWSGTDAAAVKRIKPQQIESVNRSGFTVVEWGGAEAKGLGSPVNH